MRKLIRNFLQKRGYDIVKTDMYLKGFEEKSNFSNYTFHPTPIANYYLPNNVERDIIASHMRQGKLFEPEVIELAKKYIKPNTSVLDIGANFGQMTIEFAKAVGNNGKLYSFEAQKAVYEVLTKNVQANNLTNVECFYNAVYNTDDVVMYFPEPDFNKFGAYGSFSISSVGKNGVEVISKTIDSINVELPISFMKVDVQGSDLAAMQGAIKTIAKHKMPILFEFEQQFQADFNTNFQQYVDFVQSINYRFEQTILDINFLILPNT